MTKTIICEECGCEVTPNSACNYPFCERYDPRSVEKMDDDFRLENYEEIMEEIDINYDEE